MDRERRYKEFNGELLKDFLKQKKISQSTLSKAFGYSESYISTAIYKNHIDRFLLEKICVMYDLEISDFEIVSTNEDFNENSSNELTKLFDILFEIKQEIELMSDEIIFVKEDIKRIKKWMD